MTHRAIQYAHSGKAVDRSDWQRLADHLDAVAKLARTRGAFLGLEKAAEIAGRFHDLGKYDPDFDRVLRGEPDARVDHSTAGGRELVDQAPPGSRSVAEVLAYAILGHHAGLPDKDNATEACMTRRFARPAAVLAPGWQDHLPVDYRAAGAELQARMRRDPGKAGHDLSVATRMIFSCLVDADFRDTQAFYDRLEGRRRDRDWPDLQAILPDLRRRLESHVAGFDTASPVNRQRAEIARHIRDRAGLAPGFFTLSVPTGGGKTLASLGFALDHAARHGHRRIIYAIPYTSIIDQTVQVFQAALGADVVLEHHSGIETKVGGEEGSDKARLAMEDWAAPVVVTTNVQLFESLFAARPSRCRKLHNIAGSVIVLDEAQCLPRKLLLPTLAMLDSLVAHYGCSVVICTATQPAFDSSELKQGGLPLTGRELAPDPAGLTEAFRRVRIETGAEMDDPALVAALAGTSQGFVIVNSRKHALALYRRAAEAGLDGLVHLTTRQYPAHRRRIIATIKDRLAKGQPCRLIATSLIEAGVDLDFPVGWRAEAGLDSVIQAAGRVNREGRRPLEASVLTVFTAPDDPPFGEIGKLAGAMRSTAGRFDDLLHPDAIRDWFEQVYWRDGAGRLDAGDVLGQFVLGRGETNFAFRSVAETYRMIDSPMVPVIVARDDRARKEVARLGLADPSGALARALQLYVVQIPARARETLRRMARAAFMPASSAAIVFRAGRW
ncbi:MAG: CRISPR-associated helicase Cas3' [Paracoccaceae bacterium]